MWTLSGFQSPTSGLQVPARQVQDRESQRITLVLTPTNKLEKDADLINKDSDLQQAQTDYEYLTVNGLPAIATLSRRRMNLSVLPS